MGVSSDGQLNYGWSFDVESVNEIDDDFEHIEGWKTIHHPVEDDFDNEWEELQAHCAYFPKEDASCLVVVRHCSYDYSSPIISHRECCYSNSRGYVTDIPVFDKETISRWRNELILEAKRVGFDTDALGEPKLMLTSMYG